VKLNIEIKTSKMKIDKLLLYTHAFTQIKGRVVRIRRSFE